MAIVKRMRIGNNEGESLVFFLQHQGCRPELNISPKRWHVWHVWQWNIHSLITTRTVVLAKVIMLWSQCARL